MLISEFVKKKLLTYLDLICINQRKTSKDNLYSVKQKNLKI